MKHIKLAALVAAVLLAASAEAQAQEKKAEMPKPSPEVKALGFFVGNWKTEGEMKPGPWGAGGKMSGDSRCTWMEGGYFVVCKDEATGAMGRVSGLGVMGYDAAGKHYTWNGFNSMGENDHAAGSRDGKTWTYNNESVMNGKPMKGRYTIVETSATGYDFKMESSADGKTWATVMEGKVSRKTAAGSPKQ
jgi:hypothetical protein